MSLSLGCGDDEASDQSGGPRDWCFWKSRPHKRVSKLSVFRAFGWHALGRRALAAVKKCVIIH